MRGVAGERGGGAGSRVELCGTIFRIAQGGLKDWVGECREGGRSGISGRERVRWLWLRCRGADLRMA